MAAADVESVPPNTGPCQLRTSNWLIESHDSRTSSPNRPARGSGYGTVVRSNLWRPGCSDNCWGCVVHPGRDRSPGCGTARETRADDLGHPCTRPWTSTPEHVCAGQV